MTEAWRDRDARGGRGWSAWRKSLAKGDAALPADGWRNTIPAERRPGHAGAASKGGELPGTN